MLDGVLNGMRKIIHGVNAPGVPRIVMAHMGHAVDDRVAHVDIGGSHVDLGTKHLLPILIFALLHLLKETQIFLHAPAAVRALLAGSIEIPAVLPDFLSRQVTDKGLALLDQKDGTFIHLFKIIGGKEKPVLKIRSQPLHILYNGLHKLRLLLGGVGVVKAQIKLSAVFLCQAVIQQNGLCMPDMQITVGLRREAGLHMIIYALRQILVDLLLNKIPGHRLLLAIFHYGLYLCHMFIPP